MADFIIRLSEEKDKEDIIAIFNHYITNSFAAYFIHAVPSQAWNLMYSMCIDGQMYTVEDKQGKIVGFGLLKEYLGGGCFQKTADLGYFLAEGYTNKGLGSALLHRMEEEAKLRGVTNLLANVSSLNEASALFHLKHGFKEVGRLPQVGEKHGKSFDIVWYHKQLV